MKYDILLIIKKFFSSTLTSLGKNEEFLIKGTDNSEGTFVEIFKDKDYETRRKRLCSGLDKKSIKTVETILYRIKAYIFKNKKIFTNSLPEILRLKAADHIKKLSLKKEKQGFGYGKYLLSRAHFNNEIFFDKYFIDEFKNKKNIRTKNIIDVGGFIGDTAVVFSDYTDKSVYVFEPVESNYKDLLKTIELNHTKKIIPQKLALGAENRECIINIYEPTGVGSTIRNDIIKNNDTVKEKIQITTLDEFVERENLDVGLVKVDVEGAEQDFLKGAMNTIKTQKPALLIAIYHSGIDFFTIKTKIEELNLGYKFKIRKAAKNRILEDTVLVAEVL